jgi:signal transduction histidine kinase
MSGIFSEEIERLRSERDELQKNFTAELERQKIDALAEFAAGIGHEVNNPLAIIGGHAQLLLHEIENTEHRRRLAVIAAQVKRAYEMIADVRYFARPPKPETQTIDIAALLKRFADGQTPLLQEVGIELSFETDAEALEIETDPVQLHLVMTILCNNAREILQSVTGGHIGIRLEKADAGVEIIVEDNGQGVAEEIRALVFCPYFSGRQAGRGLGFGLPKAWRILQQLGGSIRCESPAAGACFVVVLPYGPPSPPPS